ncbi:hypothetical protein HDU83_002164 [Entophlyctis luteolus]|nr:hypothetical protein HDU83_002164 [Entophlyctis luteolus]
MPLSASTAADNLAALVSRVQAAAAKSAPLRSSGEAGPTADPFDWASVLAVSFSLSLSEIESLQRPATPLVPAAAEENDPNASDSPDVDRGGGGGGLLSMFGLGWTATASTAKTLSMDEQRALVQDFLLRLEHLCVTGASTADHAQMNMAPSLLSLWIEGTKITSLIDWPDVSLIKIKTMIVAGNSVLESDASDLRHSSLGNLIFAAVQTSNAELFSRVGLMKNGLSSLSLEVIPILANVTLLDLSGNKFSAFPCALSACTQLKVLNLSQNKLPAFSLKPMTSGAIRSSSKSMHVTEFKCLTHLSLLSNEIELIGDLEEIFPALELLDLRSNNILDVFEIKSCSSLTSLKELKVSGNPISQNESHRLNIFKYFKVQSETLKLDGALPSSSEMREILVSLTITATSTSALRQPQLPIFGETKLFDSDTATISSVSGLKKRKPKKAVAVVMEATNPSTPELASSSSNTMLNAMGSAVPVQSSSRQAISGSPASTIVAGSSPSNDRNPILMGVNKKPPPLNMEREVLDLVMESLDSSDRSITPTSRVSPVPATISEQLDSVDGRAAGVALIPLNPTVAALTAMSPASKSVQSREERSFSNYYDAQQEFNYSASESESGLDVASDAEDISKMMEDLSMKPRPRMRSFRKSASTDSAFTLKPGLDVTSALKERNISPSPLRMSRQPLSEKVEETISDQLQNQGDVQDAKFIKRGFFGSHVKPNFPRLTSLATQFADSADSATQGSASSLNSSLSTPLANTPTLAERKSLELTGGSRGNVVGADWLKKMAQIHEQGRREAQRVAEEETILKNALAENTNSLAKKSKSGFEAVMESHLPPQKPLMAASGVSINSGSSAAKTGSNLESIGPYRKVYEFDHPTKARDDESLHSRPVHVSFLAESNNRSPTEEVSSPKLKGSTVVSPVPSRSIALSRVKSNESKASYVRRGDLRTADVGGSDMAPRLILARPVTSALQYQRKLRNEPSEMGSEMGASVYSSFPQRPQMMANRSVAGRGAGTSSVFSTDSNAFSIFSGITGVSAQTFSRGQQSSFYNPRSSTQITFPHSSNIPFLTINNSLQLHLKFKVLTNENEEILTWVPGSIVPQVSPYLNGIASSSANDSTFSSFVSTAASTNPKLVATIARMQTVERAAYILLTDKAIYVFTPAFAMPYDPFSTGSATASVSATAIPAEASHLTDVINQVRYDDPSRTLKLARRIPLETLMRVDVGPNRQYTGLHFLAPENSKEDDDMRRRRVSGIGVEGGLKSGGGRLPPPPAGGLKRAASGGLAVAQQNPLPGIRSLVFLTRDRIATAKLVAALEPLVGELSRKRASGTNAGMANSNPNTLDESTPRNAINATFFFLNQDIDWCLATLQQKVLLKRGGYKDIVANEIGFDGKIDLKDTAARRMGHIPPPSGESSAREKQGWLGSLFASSRTPGVQSEVSQNVQRILNEDDEDTSFINHSNFDFLKLYLLVGWIVPHKPPNGVSSSKQKFPASLAVTVNSVSLLATGEYMYLTGERFDVWPPPLFPPTAFVGPKVNSMLLQHAENVALASRRSSAAPADPFKGLSASQIPQFGAPLQVARVRDLVRCERWKTWRWTQALSITQVEEAPLLEQKVASLVQNGAIGVIKVVEDVWPIVPVTEKDRRAGATSGWDWWVRVVFRQPDTNANEASEERAAPQEYFWDLVFATLDGANEFLEFVKAVRGVKPMHETELMFEESRQEDVYLEDGDDEHGSGGAGDGEDTAGRDMRLFERVAWDGVEVVIGDD